MNLKGGNNKMKYGFLTPSLNDALKEYEEEKKKRGQQKIRGNILKIFKKSNIESLYAVCLIFKETETRSH